MTVILMPKMWTLKVFFLLGVVSIFFAFPSWAEPLAKVCKPDEECECPPFEPAARCSMTVIYNQGRFLSFKTKPVDHFIVGNTLKIDIRPLSETEAYIQGKQLGLTDLIIYSSDNRHKAVIEIEVIPPVDAIQKAIHDLVPEAMVTVSTSNGRLVLSGQVADKATADRIEVIARKFLPIVVNDGPQTPQTNSTASGQTAPTSGGGTGAQPTAARTYAGFQSLGSSGQAYDPVLNLLTIAASQQVLLEVRFLSVSRSIGKELGVSWNARGQRDFIGSGVEPGSSAEIVTDAGNQLGTYYPNVSNPPIINAFATGATAALGAPYATVLANVISGSTNLDASIRALEQRDVLRRLAEPNLVALSGQEASFVAGGSIPYNTASSGGSSNGVVGQTTFVEYGVKLNFKPTILPKGVINISLVPEVSEPDPTFTTGAGPAILKRKADTVVELRDGQTFIVAGLLDGLNKRAVSQIPWIGNLPILGLMFRDTGFQKKETELVILVTPRIIKPLAPYETVASPLDQMRSSSDRELFFGRGDLEVTANQISNNRAKSAEIVPARGHMIDATEWENVER